MELAREMEMLNEIETVNTAVIESSVVIKELAQDLLDITEEITTKVDQLQLILKVSSTQLESEAKINHLSCINNIAAEIANKKSLQATKSLILRLLGNAIPLSLPIF